jgi:hypothetical protein
MIWTSGGLIDIMIFHNIIAHHYSGTGHVIAVPVIIGYLDEVGILANIILHQDWWPS